MTKTSKGDEKKEAEKNNEAARLWISGLEAVNRKLGVARVIDLSATPFFLRGSGYAEGTLFPWTMSDFSLMDAIECGIVKLPRVPVADNIPGEEMPMFRNLWEHIRKEMPKKAGARRRSSTPQAAPLSCRPRSRRCTATTRRPSKLWKKAASRCRPASSSSATTPPRPSWSTTTSPASAENEDGSQHVGERPPGAVPQLRRARQPARRAPNTLLIDSEQLESGEALDDNFRGMAADEIERFRREIVERTGDRSRREHHRPGPAARGHEHRRQAGRLGDGIRCVVSVSMLTEGWDANTVTHVLGVRAFGTQLLCEQVIGRALRRQSYDLNEDNLFNVDTPTCSASPSTSPPSR
jgi:type III restriction enzyme